MCHASASKALNTFLAMYAAVEREDWHLLLLTEMRSLDAAALLPA